MNAHRLRPVLALAATAALAACPGRGSEVVPALPGDGTGNFAEDRAADGDAAAASDPWAGRDLIDSPPPAEPVALELPPIERFTLPSGLEVIAVRDPTLPVVSLQLAIRAGKELEARDQVGLSSFVASMLSRGTRRKSAAQIAGAIDFVGGALGASASYEATLVTCKVLSKHLDTCLELVPDMLARPSFPAAEMDIVRQDLHAQVRQRLDDAGQLASAHFQTFLWGAEHPRGWPLTQQTIDAISRDDLIRWHRQWLRPNNAVLAIAGDIDPAALRQRLTRAFGPWKKGALPQRPERQRPALDGMKVLLVDKPDQTQTHIRVGHFGLSHRDEAFYAAMIMNYSLGGGMFSSRLLERVRSEAGKSYAASSSFDRNLDVGAFVAATFTRTPETVDTVRLVREVIAEMAAEGPTEDEVRAAITNLSGSYATRFETAGDVAGALLAADLHGFGAEYVRDYPLNVAAVDREAAARAADRFLDPDDLVIVLVGNAEEIEPQLREAGWVYDTVGHLESVAPWERGGVDTAAAPADPEQARAARAVLDQALAKKGGARRLGALKTLTWRGTAELSLPGGKVPAQVHKRVLRPDKLRLDMNIGGGQVQATTVLAGDQAWGREISQRGDQTIDFPPDQAAALRAQMWREQDLVLLRHREEGASVTPLPDRTLDGRPHHAVRVVSADGALSVVLFIDKKSKVLGGMEYSDQGVKALETYGDYRRVGGLQIAHRRDTDSPQLDLSIQLDEVKIDDKLAPLLFVKPKAEPAAKP